MQIILILPESTKQHQCLLVRPSEARNPTILTKIASRPINKALIWAGPNDLVRFSCGVSCFVAHHRHRLLLVGVGARAFSLLHVLALSCVARSCKFCRGARSGANESSGSAQNFVFHNNWYQRRTSCTVSTVSFLFTRINLMIYDLYDGINN